MVQQAADHGHSPAPTPADGHAPVAESGCPQPSCGDGSDDAHAPLTPRQKSALTFLQMNTPLSLLFLVATAMFGVIIVPSMRKVFRSHVTYLTPSPPMLLAYMAVLFAFEVGFCALAIVTRNPHTQRCVLQSTGSRLALINYLLSMWLLFRILDTPATTVAACYVLGVIALLVLTNDVVLRARYRPRWVHPFELLLVHVPNRLITVLVVHVLFWQQLLLAFGWDRSHGDDALGHSFWFTVAVTVFTGTVWAAWIEVNGDFTVYATSMYLDAAVLGFMKMPIVGPRSRPLALTILVIVSMTVRSIALVVPSLSQNGLLVVCHTHNPSVSVESGDWRGEHGDAPHGGPSAPSASDTHAAAHTHSPTAPPASEEHAPLRPESSRHDPTYGSLHRTS
ncbi:hypothetical protein MSPP1_002666 [Malassezia sp. CBS 17886]|nr:hypothetical protein MSPP1_002666 [Malassezia sp. CBS 17886]